VTKSQTGVGELRRSEIKIPTSMMDESESVLDRYRDLIMNGESPGMASILASRCAPGLETATNHFVGRKSLEEAYGLDYATKVKRHAREAGIAITDSSIFNASVADERGGADPNAWLLAGDGPDKWRDVAQKRGCPSEDLKVKDDGRIAEIEAKREEGINRRNAIRAAREAEAADKMKKVIG
jgi:hypothetical protein